MSTTLSIDTPVGEIAREVPESIAVFERRRIDYCCHGHDSLEAACARVGCDARAVLAEIDALERRAPAMADRAAAERMSDLCDEIERTHHVLAREILGRLDVVLPRIAAAHAAHHPEFTELAHVAAGLREDMFDHMIREERVLFPWLRRLEHAESITKGPPWSVRRPIDCMIHDHEEVAAALERMRALTSDFTVPDDACASVRAAMQDLRRLDSDTRLHVHKENNILFPAGIRAEQELSRHGPGLAS